MTLGANDDIIHRQANNLPHRKNEMERKFNVTTTRTNAVNGLTYFVEHVSVPAELIDFDNMLLLWSKPLPIVKIEERSEKLMAAEAAYFDRFGTACE